MLPGRLVSLVGEGDTLLLVTHSGHQSLAYSLYKVGVSGVSHCHPATPTLPLPLSPGKSHGPRESFPLHLNIFRV